MLALALATALSVAPTGAAAKLVAIWLDHGSPYMELRPYGSGRIGALENAWSAEEKGQIHVVNKDSGDTYDIPYTLEDGGRKLKLIVQSTQVELERSKQRPAAKAPPPPKKPSELAAEESADAGTKLAKKKKGKGK
jgi:hypothetical protein